MFVFERKALVQKLLEDGYDFFVVQDASFELCLCLVKIIFIQARTRTS